MNIEEIKIKVVNDCSLLGGGLPSDPDSIHCDDWSLLVVEIAKCLRHIENCCLSINNHLEYAMRKANGEP